jgi:hypothetical protein
MAYFSNGCEGEILDNQCAGRGKGADMTCKAGMNLKEIRKVLVGSAGLKWGPCIQGHLLKDPTAHCPHWIRRTREMGEARADAFEKAMERMAIAHDVVSAWRKKEPRGKAEIIECPVCKGKLHLSQAGSNGHVHGHCETDGCLSWME